MCLHYVSKKNGKKIARYRCTTTFKRGWSECPVKEVNADEMENWARDRIMELAVDGELLGSAIAAANAADEQRTGPLRGEQAALVARINEVRAKVDRLVAAIADGGSGFQAIRAKLTLEEQNLRLLEHDLTKVKTEIGRAAGAPLEAHKLRQILQDFDLLFAVANAQERVDLLRLIIKRIRGREAEVTMELFSAANLKAESSNLRAPWLRRRGSNPRPGG